MQLLSDSSFRSLVDALSFIATGCLSVSQERWLQLTRFLIVSEEAKDWMSKKIKLIWGMNHQVTVEPQCGQTCTVVLYVDKNT